MPSSCQTLLCIHQRPIIQDQTLTAHPPRQDLGSDRARAFRALWRERFRIKAGSRVWNENELSGNVPLGTLALRGSRRAYALVILGRDTATRGVCAGVPPARGLMPARQGLRLEQGECEQSRAGGNGNVLPAIELITDG